MLTEGEREGIGAQTRILQVITGAMVVGTLTFLAVAIGLAPVAGDMVLPPWFDLLSVGLAVAAVVAWVGLPIVIAQIDRQQFGRRAGRASESSGSSADDPRRVDGLLALYQRRMIAGNAVLEGGAFLQLMAYLLMARPLNLGLALALIALLVAQIPGRERVEHWIEEELATREAVAQQR